MNVTSADDVCVDVLTPERLLRVLLSVSVHVKVRSLDGDLVGTSEYVSDSSTVAVFDWDLMVVRESVVVGDGVTDRVGDIVRVALTSTVRLFVIVAVFVTLLVRSRRVTVKLAVCVALAVSVSVIDLPGEIDTVIVTSAV